MNCSIFEYPKKYEEKVVYLQATFFSENILLNRTIFGEAYTTSNYSFYNQIVSHIKELLSNKQHHGYDISLRKLMSEYLNLKNSEKELVDSKDLLSAFISGDKRLLRRD